MSLTREDLENDRFREHICKANPNAGALTAEQIEASLRGTLALRPEDDRGDIWLFAYGSLIWNPLIHVEEHEVTRLSGYHRRFCLWSTAGRGTPRQPGLVLGLDAGGCCQGVALRVRADHAVDELRLVWRREMVVGSYCPRWVRVSNGGVTRWAITFAVNRRHPGYAGRLHQDEVVEAMVRTRGHLGSPVEYLLKTVEGLESHGVHDPHLVALRERVLAVQAGTADSPYMTA
jgi:cation transport protein ChaC